MYIRAHTIKLFFDYACTEVEGMLTTVCDLLQTGSWCTTVHVRIIIACSKPTCPIASCMCNRTLHYTHRTIFC